MSTTNRQPNRKPRKPFNLLLSEGEKKKAEAIAEAYGGIGVSDAIRKAIAEFDLAQVRNPT